MSLALVSAPCLAFSLFATVGVAASTAPAVNVADDQNVAPRFLPCTPQPAEGGESARPSPSAGQRAVASYIEKKSASPSAQGAPTGWRFPDNLLGNRTGVVTSAPSGSQELPRLSAALVPSPPTRKSTLDRDTSVNAQVFNGYTRTRTVNGRHETYVFADGGFQDNSGMRDRSIDDLSFEDLARLLAPSLAQQGYYPPADAQKLETIDLVLVVYWGSTAGKYDPLLQGMGPAERLRVNRRNARVLGYQDAVSRVLGNEWVGSIRTRAHDLIDEVEEKRYWVALVALDFATARKEKKIKLLWSIRYNMASQGTDFSEALPQMTKFASVFFGRDTHGLLSPSLEPPKGKVELGELKVLPDPAAAAK